MKIAILAAGCLSLCVCSCAVSVHEAFFDKKDVTKSVARHGYLTRGQSYVINRELGTNGRHLFARGAKLDYQIPRRASGSERYDRSQLLKEPATLSKGTLMRLKSVVAEDGINVDVLIIDFEVLKGPWAGRILGVPVHQDELTLGSEGTRDLRMNPKVFTRTVTP